MNTLLQHLLKDFNKLAALENTYFLPVNRRSPGVEVPPEVADLWSAMLASPVFVAVKEYTIR